MNTTNTSDVTPPIGARSAIDAIARIWNDVLGADGSLDVDTNFFDLGGDSLRLLRVQRLLRERLNADIGGVDLFEHTTIRQLAAFVEQAARR